jgi:L-ornithine Nalpha-acyltransferase
MQDMVAAGVRKVFEAKVFAKMRPMLLPEGQFLGKMPRKSNIVRDTLGLPVILGRLGSLEVRLATTRKEIRRAQRLRFKVFYNEMSAIPDPTTRLIRRDKDAFDRVCDHLLVIDHDFKGGPLRRKKPKVVGTYRLLRQETADDNFGFYTSSEFDVDSLIARHPGQRFLELGRSCVLPEYRTKKTVELLWQGIWAYVLHHRVDVMFGCASLEGTSPESMRQELSFMHHFAPPAEPWQASALPMRYISMNRMEKESIDAKRAIVSLPPLIKAYLRLGARIGDGAVIDHQFGTTDVLIILRVADIDPKYINYYGSDAKRYAA